jgi:hypothetical protein
MAASQIAKVAGSRAAVPRLRGFHVIGDMRMTMSGYTIIADLAHVARAKYGLRMGKGGERKLFRNQN